MKRWAWLLLLALAAPGCLTPPPKVIEEPPVPPVKQSDLKPPPVKPDQVNENNAQEMLQALQAEVERDRNAPPPGQR